MEMDKLVFIAGLLVLIDAVGSILLPGNTHRFWYNAERVARGTHVLRVEIPEIRLGFQV
jgi:hypothetical protein